MCIRDSSTARRSAQSALWHILQAFTKLMAPILSFTCLLYTSDAADERSSVDLGGFYLDILKDRLYTTAPNSTARRSAQSALWHILQAFTKLMAPILSFTAEEVWQLLTGDAEQSVMFQRWHELPKPAGEGDLLAKWSQIRDVRAEVTKGLEALREAGKTVSYTHLTLPTSDLV